MSRRHLTPGIHGYTLDEMKRAGASRTETLIQGLAAGQMDSGLVASNA